MDEKTLRRLTAPALILLLGACAAPANRPTAPAPSAAKAAPAATALAASASVSLGAGDYEAAAASLERALRIEPENPALWHQLAQVRLSAGDAARAERLATRSIHLAAGQPRLVRANWQLIARARRLRGDSAGAAEAQARARR